MIEVDVRDIFHADGEMTKYLILGRFDIKFHKNYHNGTKMV